MNETIKRLKEMLEQIRHTEDQADADELISNFERSLIVAFPDLLTYIEELEKKVEAGKVLAEAGKRLRIGLNIIGYSKKLGELRSEYDTALDTYNKAIK